MPQKHPRRRQKPVSLSPLEPEDALAGLLQVQLPGKDAVPDEQGKEEAEPETKEST